MCSQKNGWWLLEAPYVEVIEVIDGTDVVMLLKFNMKGIISGEASFALKNISWNGSLQAR